MLSRRGFLSVLASLPIVGRFVSRPSTPKTRCFYGNEWTKSDAAFSSELNQESAQSVTILDEWPTPDCYVRVNDEWYRFTNGEMKQIAPPHLTADHPARDA